MEKSKGVAEQFRIVAERQNVHFLNAADCEFNQVDFMHLTRKATHSWRICWQRKCRRFYNRIYNRITSRPGFLLRKPGAVLLFLQMGRKRFRTSPLHFAPKYVSIKSSKWNGTEKGETAGC